jgi:Trypsin-like peptidase domain
MIQRFTDTFASNPPPEVKMLLELMATVLSDEQYRGLVAKTLSKGHNFAQRKPLLDLGFFSLTDLFSLLLGESKRTTLNSRTVSALLRRLADWSLVTDNDFEMSGQLVRYQWVKGQIELFATLGILDNVLLGRPHIVTKYTPSIPAIIVEKEGAEFVGTGFLIHDHHRGKHFDGNGFVVTAKHNVDPAENIRFLRFDSSASIEFTPGSADWHHHPTLDIAAMAVSVKGLVTPIYPFGEQLVLSRTISLGYPKISTTDGLYLLAHSGELNAIVSSYMGGKKYLIISNNVSPGSSGRPILDDAGLCIGMVTRSFETEYDGGISKANAAIPASEIHAFIGSLRRS